jgi:tight adherence protein B
MDSTFFSILLALAVAVLTWGVGRAVAGWIKNEKRRLHNRLGGQGSTGAARTDARANVTVSQVLPKGLSGKLAQRGFLTGLSQQLATLYPQTTLLRFLLICAGTGLALCCVGLLVSGSVIAGLVAGAIGAYAPIFLVRRKAASRRIVFTRQLPEALDFLSRILRAGHSLSTGLQMMAEELPEPLRSEFARCYDQHSLGQPLEACLREMAERIGSSDFGFFVTAIVIQRQTGGDLAQVLGNISSMIRGRMRLQQYVRAKTAEGRMTGYILVAFPALMFVLCYIMNPVYGGTLLKTTLGLEMLGASVTFQVMGLIAIRKITQVKV